jgi:hypothetical protein
MTSATDSFRRAKFSAERDMFVQYAERESNIIQIRSLLNLPLDACEELYKKMQTEVQSWAEVTPYSFRSIWEPARERYRTMMCSGVWNYETWKKAVFEIVLNFNFKTTFSFILNWNDIEEIEF